jgi:hypothetical protein
VNSILIQVTREDAITAVQALVKAGAPHAQAVAAVIEVLPESVIRELSEV